MDRFSRTKSRFLSRLEFERERYVPRFKARSAANSAVMAWLVASVLSYGYALDKGLPTYGQALVWGVMGVCFFMFVLTAYAFAMYGAFQGISFLACSLCSASGFALAAAIPWGGLITRYGAVTITGYLLALIFSYAVFSAIERVMDL